MKRKHIPKAVEERVRKEFSHLCAICGGKDPQIHHIDNDPSNNDPLNLVPICPNHHLNDIHDPTSCPDPRKVAIFRKYKDPLVLSSEFQPLFKRFVFILELDSKLLQFNKLEEKSHELVRFVKSLQMGDFYSEEIGKMILPTPYGGVMVLGEYDPKAELRESERWSEYLDQVKSARDQVVELCVELLRYQGWNMDPDCIEK